MRFREEKTEEKGGLRMEAKCVKMIISIEKKLNAIEMQNIIMMMKNGIMVQDDKNAEIMGI